MPAAPIARLAFIPPHCRLLTTMRFAVRLLVLITAVLGLGMAFAWAWDRSDARAQAGTPPAAQIQPQAAADAPR